MQKELFWFIGLLIKVVLIFFFWPFLLNLWLYQKIRKGNLNRTLKLGLIGVVSLFLLPFGFFWTHSVASAITSPTSPETASSETVTKKEPSPTFIEKPAESSAITTRAPTSVPTPEEFLKVTRVIDGDTIVLENGAVVRYIGINAPETRRSGNECFAHEAREANKRVVLGKVVKLEKDVSETDKYNRLLRYVWIDDVFVNEYLVREGYAYTVSYPPDVKYQQLFQEAEKEARVNSRGLWNPQACPIPISTPIPTPKPDYRVLPAQTKGKYTCDCSKTCSEMSSCEEAYYQLTQCGCKARDGDKDGVPCESICR